MQGCWPGVLGLRGSAAWSGSATSACSLVYSWLSVSTGGTTPGGCGRRAFLFPAARSAWAPRSVAVGLELFEVPV